MSQQSKTAPPRVAGFPISGGHDVEIVMDASGSSVPRRLLLNGVEMEHVAKAVVLVEPNDVLRIELTLYCASVSTRVEVEGS